MNTPFVLLSLVALGAGPARDPSRPACHARETSVVVETQAHTLHLCESGRSAARYRVALGSGGVGKRRMGDGKTPLGLYVLAAPRASQDYRIFVHVGYPTPAQQRLGFTGNAIGIHGPPRTWTGGSLLGTAVDWTAGCIAVGSDAEIEAISAWVRRLRVKNVRID